MFINSVDATTPDLRQIECSRGVPDGSGTALLVAGRANLRMLEIDEIKTVPNVFTLQRGDQRPGGRASCLVDHPVPACSVLRHQHWAYGRLRQDGVHRTVTSL